MDNSPKILLIFLAIFGFFMPAMFFAMNRRSKTRAGRKLIDLQLDILGNIFRRGPMLVMALGSFLDAFLLHSTGRLPGVAFGVFWSSMFLLGFRHALHENGLIAWGWFYPWDAVQSYSWRNFQKGKLRIEAFYSVTRIPLFGKRTFRFRFRVPTFRRAIVNETLEKYLPGKRTERTTELK